MKVALIILGIITAIIAGALIAAIVLGKNTAKKDIMLRYYLIFVVIAAFFLVVLYRICYLQYVEGDRLRAIVERRRTEPDTIKAKRGNILSDDGRLMASSIPRYYLYLDMRVEGLNEHPKGSSKTYFETHVKELSRELSALLKDRSPEQYERDLTKAFRRKTARCRIYPGTVSYIDYLKIKEFPILRRGPISGGFTAEERVTRVKPFERLASRTIGDIYGVSSKGGRNGLELYYDSILRGSDGIKIRRKMAGRRTDIIVKQPVDGLDIVSTIDIDIQETVERELLAELTRTEARNGTAIVMDVKTGEIKAITNLVRDGKGEYRESVNLAVSSQVEPGSTFKLLSYMVALEDGVIDTSTVVNTGNGLHKFSNRYMRDWNYGGPNGGFGSINVIEAMNQSSNVAVSMLIDQAYGSDPAKFVNGLKRTGIDKDLELELPGHGKVYIKDPSDKSWSNTTLPWMSIGYEVQVPPIYTLMAYNAVANDGRMMKPIFARGVQKNGVMVETFSPEVVNESICSPETLGKLRHMLEDVVENGTGKLAGSELFKVAGKTGTAQIFEAGTNKNAEGRTRHQITFCGYFPAEKPMYSCVVYIREPKMTASAGRMCGTVFRNIAERAYILQSRKTPELTPAEGDKQLRAAREAEAAERAADAFYPEDGMPDLTGMGAARATAALEGLGIETKIAGVGRVIRQSPEPGSPITKDTKAELILN